MPDPNARPKIPGLENFSPEEITAMYKEILEGKMPEALKNMQHQPKYTDENGKPIIDEEGGAYIQPNAGFVIKSKDKSGEKVFVNIVQHEVIDPVTE